MTLEFVIVDYLRHVKHHMAQIRSRAVVEADLHCRASGPFFDTDV